ncbi:Hypothetical protein, putative, partial [Bodo saltans]
MSEWRGAKQPIDGKPPTPFELGNAGWIILHTAAAAFPNKPSADQKNAMRDFIQSWSKVYACSHCAYHMRTVLATKPPVVENKRAVSRYICELHNDVNYMLGKDTFNCDPDVVLKRWHPTYPSMEDEPTIEEQIAASNNRGVPPPPAPKPPSGGNSRRWWGSSATGGATPTENGSAAPSRASKVSDTETDPAAVLARLKGC